MELLVALVLLGIVSMGIYRVLVNNQRVYQSQTQRIDLQQNIRAAVSVLPAELRELDATDGDIVAMNATGISVRAMRQLAIICNTPVLGIGAAVIAIRPAPFFFGTRDFNTATDSVYVYYEGDQATRNDDSWVIGRVTAVAAGVCADGRPGRLLTTTLSFGTVMSPQGVNLPQFNQTGRISSGAPIHGWQRVTYRLYQAADGRYYIGLDDGSGLQPLIGPVLANGLSLEYYDSTGAVTAVPARVAMIDVTVRAQTAQPVRQGSTLVQPVDSITIRVSLRNNRRF